jgi:hypothetical protein
MGGREFGMLTVEVKGRNAKFTWEIVGIYRAPNEDMRAIEGLESWIDSLGNLQSAASLQVI